MVTDPSACTAPGHFTGGPRQILLDGSDLRIGQPVLPAPPAVGVPAALDHPAQGHRRDTGKVQIAHLGECPVALGRAARGAPRGWGRHDESAPVELASRLGQRRLRPVMQLERPALRQLTAVGLVHAWSRYGPPVAPAPGPAKGAGRTVSRPAYTRPVLPAVPKTRRRPAMVRNAWDVILASFPVELRPVVIDYAEAMQAEKTAKPP